MGERASFSNQPENFCLFSWFLKTPSHDLLAFENDQPRDQLVIDSFADLLNGADVADIALRDIQVTTVRLMMTILRPMTKNSGVAGKANDHNLKFKAEQIII